MTRNDAYKAARRAWRQRAKRGCVGFGYCWQNIAGELAVSGATWRDVAMVRAWLKAFYAGRRWPDEETMRAIETQKE